MFSITMQHGATSWVAALVTNWEQTNYRVGCVVFKPMINIVGAIQLKTKRTSLPCNTNTSIRNLDDTNLRDLASSIIYIKRNDPTKNKQPTLTGAITGQSNVAPLKATHNSHLVVSPLA